MRLKPAVLCLVTSLALPYAAPAKDRVPPVKLDERSPAERLEAIDGQLHRGEWAAAEAESRSVVSAALLKQGSGTFDAVARLALAEAGLGRTEDALWYWAVAQNLEVDFDPKPFGAPGALLASHTLRHRDEVPAGLDLRRQGEGGSPFSSPRVVAAKPIDLPAVWGALPRGIELQVIVDDHGRLVEPVVTQSSSAVFTYVVLRTLHDSSFEPARAGERPVATFYELKTPVRRPLAEVAEFTGSPLAAPEAALRAGRYSEAAQQIEKDWVLNERSRGYLGVVLALKAMAEAGLGKTEGAICRWQAAQTLEPRLYGADLSAYGAAGKLLAGHPWGEAQGKTRRVSQQGGPSEQVLKPEILERPVPKFPEALRPQRSPGRVIAEGIITATGSIRNLVLLTPDAPPGMEANTLDALCDWRFKPARYHGEPVPVYYVLTVHFGIR